MENPKKGLVIPLLIGLVVVLVVIAGGYFYWQKVPVPQNVSDNSNTEPQATAPDQTLSCKENANYFVVLQNTEPMVLNVLVKHKTNSDQKKSCVYNVEKSDLEIKNLEATYFLALTDNFLVLDSGTAPEPRGLTAYNLSNLKEVYTDRYAKPLTTSGDTITYWSPVRTEPTEANCPELNTWTSEGLGAVIEAKIILNLLNLSKKDLGQTRCQAMQ